MEKIRVNEEIPLIGCIAFGIIDRGTNLLQVRPTSLCNLNCAYCSTCSGVKSELHEVYYEVDLDYLLRGIKEMVEFKTEVEINIDSVGEPTSYPKLLDLIKGVKNINGVEYISMQTNGVLLNDRFVKELEKAGLNRINLSINSLNETLAKELSGCNDYPFEKILKLIKNINYSKIELILTPVWIKGINDEEIIKLIKLAKEINCKIGIQNYEIYKYSRKIKNAKKITYWKFFDQLSKWEKEFGIKLKYSAQDFNIKRVKSLPILFEIGDKLNIEVVCKGWFKGQMIGRAKNRAITINNCKAKIGDRVNIKIVENKNNLYIAE